MPRRLAVVIAAAVLMACSPAVVTPTTTTVTTTTTAALTTTTASAVALDVQAATTDVDGFLRQLEMVHPEPFHGITREEFVAELEAYKEALADLTPEQSLVEFMRITALLSANGRDGHQFAIPYANEEGPILPIMVYEFDDGLAVTAGRGEAEALVGLRLESIGGHPIDEVLDLVEPLVPRDGPATLRAFRPVFFLRTDVLVGLGVIERGPVELVAAGQEPVMVEPISFDEFVAWGGFTTLPSRDDLLYRQARPGNFWVEPVTVGGVSVLYARYAQVQSPEGAEVSELVELGADPEYEAVVLDLRHNGGGNNFTYPPLLEAVQQISAERPGVLRVLTDRVTFSAASNLATEIEQTTDAVFVGEPMGGGLNFWNDVQFYPMPHLPIPMRVGISTIYWEKSTPDDQRLTIEPEIAVPSLAADYFEGRDPVLEAAAG